MVVSFCKKCGNRTDDPPGLMSITVECPICRGFKLSKPACGTCDGSGRHGYALGEEPCQTCGGNGLKNDHTVLIPCWFCEGRGVTESAQVATCDNIDHVRYREGRPGPEM